MRNHDTQGKGSARALRKASALAAALALATTIVSSPTDARAEEVTPTAKGIVGGALLGGEAVVITESLLNVKSTTAYLVGGGLGAVAGGVGGYFIEQAVDDGRVPVYMLAGGLALVIPAVVLTLNATRYMPSEGAIEDKPTGPPADPGQAGGSSVLGAEPPKPAPAPAPGGGAAPAPAPAPAPGGGTAPPTQGPQSLLDVNQGAVRIGVPVPEVRPVLSVRERVQLNAQASGSELRFPVLRFAF